MRSHRRILLLLILAMISVACDAASTVEPATPAPSAVATASATGTPASMPTPTPDQASPTGVPGGQPTPSPDQRAAPTPLGTPAPASDRPTPIPPPTPTATRIPPEGPNDSCVSDPNPKLTHAITDLDKILFIVPMIVPSGNWLKNRSYFKIKDDPSAGPGEGYEVPVYAPVDGMLTGITRYVESVTTHEGVLVEQDQFDLEFRVSCEVIYGFDHVARLVGDAEVVQPAVASLTTRDAQKSVRVPIAAGDLLGYTKGTSGAHTFDFIFRHTESDVVYGNQERYATSGDLLKLFEAECPYDFYDDPLRAQYLALLGGWGGGATGADGCLGSPDVLGTVSGGWFGSEFSGDAFGFTDWGAVVVLGADATVEVNDGQRMVRTRPTGSTYALPASITGEHCYEHMNMPATFAYLSLISSTQMAIATGEGTCPASLPANHKIVYR